MICFPIMNLDSIGENKTGCHWLKALLQIYVCIIRGILLCSYRILDLQFVSVCTSAEVSF